MAAELAVGAGQLVAAQRVGVVVGEEQSISITS
jgi:hypothetical protein